MTRAFDGDAKPMNQVDRDRLGRARLLANRGLEESATQHYWSAHALADARQRHRDPAAGLARTDALLTVHLQQRDIVLAESAVAQIRGVFRFGRVLLFTGIVITAIGAALYAVHLPAGGNENTGGAQEEDAKAVAYVSSRSSAAQGRPVEATITEDLPDAVADCDVALTGVAMGDVDRTKQMTIVVTDPVTCAGTWTLPARSARVEALD